jgi:hypothetical protein
MRRAEHPSSQTDCKTGETGKMKSTKLKVAVAVFLAFVMAIPVVG